MREKANGDSTLGSLNAGQRHRVDQWLFEENCTYREVVENCRREFQLEVSLSSVARYFRREYAERTMDRYSRRAVEEEETLKALGNARNSERSYRVLLRMAEMAAAREAMKPEGQCDFRKVGYLMRVVIAAREAATEVKRVKLLREKFEYNAAIAGLAAREDMKHMDEEDILREEERVEEFRRRLFGDQLPDDPDERTDEPTGTPNAQAENGEK